VTAILRALLILAGAVKRVLMVRAVNRSPDVQHPTLRSPRPHWCADEAFVGVDFIRPRQGTRGIRAGHRDPARFGQVHVVRQGLVGVDLTDPAIRALTTRLHGHGFMIRRCGRATSGMDAATELNERGRLHRRFLHSRCWGGLVALLRYICSRAFSLQVHRSCRCVDARTPHSYERVAHALTPVANRPCNPQFTANYRGLGCPACVGFREPRSRGEAGKAGGVRIDVPDIACNLFRTCRPDLGKPGPHQVSFSSPSGLRNVRRRRPSKRLGRGFGERQAPSASWRCATSSRWNGRSATSLRAARSPTS
jgi:hypothetical protein